MKRLFYAVVALQLLFLLGEVGVSHMKLRGGRVVTLKCAPVDPRSLFMGNYMILSYDVSTIDLTKTAVDSAEMARFQPGETVYVGLVPGNPHATAQDVSLRPAHMTTHDQTRTPYLRGRITGRSGSVIQVEYGLERYYIPEAKQSEAERAQFGGGQLSVQVAIDEDGEGIIKRVVLDGKSLRF